VAGVWSQRNSSRNHELRAQRQGTIHLERPIPTAGTLNWKRNLNVTVLIGRNKVYTNFQVPFVVSHQVHNVEVVSNVG